MLINRHRPGVAKCDNCRQETVPTISWSLSDDSDGLGVMGLGSVHLCEDCLGEQARILGDLPPFLEVMRKELADAGVIVAPKARYEDVRAQYREAGLDSQAMAEEGEAAAAAMFGESTLTESPAKARARSRAKAAADAPAPDAAPARPTIPDIRRMQRADLEAAIQAHTPWYDGGDMPLEQLREGFIAALEQVAEVPAETA